MVGRPKGHPKTGGRVKGTPNKRTDVFGVCQSIGLDPFLELAKFASGCADDNLRFAALKELCQYLEPKRKAIEHSGKLDPQVLEHAEVILGLPPEELIKLAREEIKELES